MCYSDEFDSGSELASLAFSHVPRPSPRKAHKGASGRSSGSSTTPICYHCLDPNAEKSYKGVWLHMDSCFNAVRARQRQTRADKPLAAQDIQDMKTNVARWREKHEPFMTKDPTARTTARLQVQSHILVGESVKKTSEKNISDDMILNKTRYKNYRKFWDGCESDTASEDFAAMGVFSDFEYGEMSTLMQSTLRGLAMPGARTWLVTVTDRARHSSPTGVPVAGVGCVLVPLSDALFVHGCSMTKASQWRTTTPS